MAYTAIDNPELYFQVKLYTGDGSTQSITLDGDEDMQPDMVWIKNRGGADGHNLFDAVRGATKRLRPNDETDENIGADTLTSFDSDGFSLGADTTGDGVNISGYTPVAWCWEESATSGTDIVTFTGTGGTQNISHSLSAVPEMIICKSRSAAGAWYTYHAGVASDAETDYLKLNANEAVADGVTVWNDTAPTTSVFTVGSAFDNTTTYVAYAFAPKQGYSKFGSYTGNGSTNGSTVWCGFTPAFVLIKSTASGVWRLWDNKRDALNPNTANFQTNASDAEYDDASVSIDFLSSGFKVRSTDSSYNGSGTSYAYMTFAEAPFVNSNGVPCNAR
jgi:hypothetical protein